MNSLSWFLYWIDVVGSISGILAASAVILLGSICVLWIATAMRLDESKEIEKSAVRANRNTWTIRLAATALSCAILASFLPSKNTMYAIAASEVGERMVRSEVVQGMANDATKALQQWIKRQIDPEKKS